MAHLGFSSHHLCLLLLYETKFGMVFVTRLKCIKNVSCLTVHVRDVGIHLHLTALPVAVKASGVGRGGEGGRRL
jgi:hypothetical protein